MSKICKAAKIIGSQWIRGLEQKGFDVKFYLISKWRWEYQTHFRSVLSCMQNLRSLRHILYFYRENDFSITELVADLFNRKGSRKKDFGIVKRRPRYYI